MSPRPDRTGRHVVLGVLFVAGGLLLAVFANLTSSRIQAVLDRLPVWLYLIAMAALLAGGVAMTILYERLTRRTGRDSTASSRGDGRQRLPARQPSRRALAAFGLGTAAAGVTAGAAAPRLFAWLASALDPPAQTQAEEPNWRHQTLQPEMRRTVLADVTYSPDGKILAAGFTSGTIVLWDTTTRSRRVLFNGIEAYSVAFSPDGRTLAAHSRGDSCFSRDSTTLWDVPTGRKAGTFEGQWLGAEVAFSPEGDALACFFSSDCDDEISMGGGVVELWDIGAHKKVARLSWPGARMSAGAFSPDGRILAAGGLIEETKNSDTTVPTSAVSLWDTTTREQLGTLIHPETNVQAVAFSPDSGLLATGGIRYEGGSKAGLMLWDVATRENVAVLAHPGGFPASLAFSPDGKTLAAALSSDSGTGVALWNTASRQRITILTRPGLNPRSVAFSPDGRSLAVGGGRGDVHLWTKRETE